MSSSDGGDRPPGRAPGVVPAPEPNPGSTLAGVNAPRAGKRATLPPPYPGSPGSPHPAPPRDTAPGQGAASPYAPPPHAVHPPSPASGPTATPFPGSGPIPHALSGPATQPYPGPGTQPNPAPYPVAAPPAQPYAGSGPAPQSYAGSGPVPQPYAGSGPVPQPYAGSGPAPQPYAGSGPTPQPYPGSGPVPQPYAGSGPVPQPAPPHTPAPHPGAGESLIEEIPGSQFVSFLKISSKRAFRLRIEPEEVLPAERRSLERASPPILDRNLQAFLAWRRSVLFLVACALVPLTIIGLGDALRSTQWRAIFFVKLAPAVAEGLFAWICWGQLKKWAHWRTQRRMLFWGWLLFMLTPFIVFVYPLETIIGEVRAAAGSKAARDAMLALGWTGIYQKTVQPFAFSMLAMLQLAPKAISLMPGLIRSSMVIKLLFPGVSAPGWLIVMSSPMYALLAYVILIIPYQFTGSGYFIAGILGVVAAQAVLARSGFKLARPLTEEEALRHVKRVRFYYMTVMVISAVLIVVALGSLVAKLNLRVTDVILAVLKFESNVLILTMIGADLVITNLDKARHYTAGRDDVEDATEHKIAAFVSLDHQK